MPHHATNSLLLALSAAVPIGVSSFPLPNPIPYANITIPHPPHLHLHTRETEWQRYKSTHPKPPRPAFGSISPTPVSPPPPLSAKEEPRHCRGRNQPPPCHPYTPNHSNTNWKHRALFGAFLLLGIGAGAWGTHHNGKETLSLQSMSMPTETGAGRNMVVMDEGEVGKWLKDIEVGTDEGHWGTGKEGKILHAHQEVEEVDWVEGPPSTVQEEGDRERAGYVFRGDEGVYRTKPRPGERVYSEEEVGTILRVAEAANRVALDAKAPVEKVNVKQAEASEGGSGKDNGGSTSDNSWIPFQNPPPHDRIPKAVLVGSWELNDARESVNRPPAPQPPKTVLDDWKASEGDYGSTSDFSRKGVNPPPTPQMPKARLADWKTSDGDFMSANDGSAPETGNRDPLPEMQGSGSTHHKLKGDPSFKDSSIWYGKGLDDTVPVGWEWVTLGETSKGESMPVIDESTSDGSTLHFSWKGANPPPTPKFPKAVLAEYKVGEDCSMSVNDGGVRGGSVSEANSMSANYGGTSEFSWKGVNPPPPPQPAKAVLAEYKASEGDSMSANDGSTSSGFSWRGLNPPPHPGLPELKANQIRPASEADSMSANYGSTSDLSLKEGNPAPHETMPKVVHWEAGTGKEVWKDGSGSGSESRSGSDLNSAGTVAHNKLVDGGGEAVKSMGGIVHWETPKVTILDPDSDWSDVSSSGSEGGVGASFENPASPPPSLDFSSSGNQGGDGATSEDSSSSGSSVGSPDSVDEVIAWG